MELIECEKPEGEICSLKLVFSASATNEFLTREGFIFVTTNESIYFAIANYAYKYYKQYAAMIPIMAIVSSLNGTRRFKINAPQLLVQPEYAIYEFKLK